MDRQTDGWKKCNIEVAAVPKNLEKPTLSTVNAGPTDTKFLYYPLHVEGVTLKG